MWSPFNTLNAADYTNIWLNDDNINKTIPSINEQYPFITRQKFAYSTGGCYKGYKDPNNKTCTTTFDLLNDPSDPNSAFNFSQLGDAIANVIAMNLKPYIVTGLIPIAFSINATLSDAKNLNELPPTYSIEKYGDYIYEFGLYLKNRFGSNEIKEEWLFGVITEYNNLRHFDNINDVNTTAMEYFQIYDYTECSLKRAFGLNDAFKIGAHACRNCANRETSWDPDELLNHVANEKNYCSGIIGDTQMDFYSSSFYETQPGKPGDQSMFDEYICSMHDAVEKYGLMDRIKEIAIDEGRIIADQYGVQIPHRAIGHTYQASFDALLFKNMIRCNISRFTRWAINTNGVGLYTPTSGTTHVESIDPVSANVAKLTYKMMGDKMLDLNVKYRNDQETESNNIQIVDGLSSIAENGMINVFLFNHHSDLNSKQTANVTLNVGNILQNGTNNYCNVSEWMIDDDHSQFWNLYWRDVINHNISSFCPVGWSNQSESICLSDSTEQDFIQSRTPIYKNASKLYKEEYQIKYEPDSCIEISKQVMPYHSVRLFQISC